MYITTTTSVTNHPTSTILHWFFTVPEACPNPTIKCHLPTKHAAVLPCFFLCKKMAVSFLGWFFSTRRLVRIREILVGIQEATLRVQRFHWSMLGPWKQKKDTTRETGETWRFKTETSVGDLSFFLLANHGGIVLHGFTGNKNKGFPVNTIFFLQIEMVIQNEVLIQRMGNGYYGIAMVQSSDQDFFPEIFGPIQLHMFLLLWDMW